MSRTYAGTVAADALTASTGNITITAGSLVIGANTLSAAELGFVDGVTAGTAAASKAVVLGAAGEIATITTGTITTLTSTTGNITTVNATNFVMNAGAAIDLDSNTATLSSNAATLTKRHVQVTTESLTTAAGASQALVLTLTGIAATDIVTLTRAGGTNTRKNFDLEVVCTANTATVTVYNNEPTNALNGTIIFNILIMKA